MPDPTMRSSKPVTRPVRQNSYIRRSRITRSSQAASMEMHAIQSKQSSTSSGCIVAKQEAILDCGVSNPETVTPRWRSAQTAAGWRRHLHSAN
jgi:hypothetical protein